MPPTPDREKGRNRNEFSRAGETDFHDLLDRLNSPEATNAESE